MMFVGMVHLVTETTTTEWDESIHSSVVADAAPVTTIDGACSCSNDSPFYKYYCYNYGDATTACDGRKRTAYYYCCSHSDSSGYIDTHVNQSQNCLQQQQLKRHAKSWMGCGWISLFG
jgi:hypothetical protein